MILVATLSFLSILSALHTICKGYVVYMDNFYSSPVLFEDLFAEQITASRTIQSNKKIPKFSADPKPSKEHVFDIVKYSSTVLA